MNKKEPEKIPIRDVTVSVVIPFCAEFTPESMLSEAIESVENQKRVDTELIVVEDEEQRGPAWARNVGLDRADTRYVAFLDADDIWVETKLVDQLQQMDKTGAGFCVDGETEYSPIEFVGALLTGETHGLTSAITIDANRVSARFDESLNRREDHLFMIEAAMQAGVCFRPKTFIDRTHEDGLSHYVDSTPEEIDEFYQRVIDVAPEATQYRQDYYQHAYAFLGRKRHFDSEYRQAVRYFSESLRYGPNLFAGGGVAITLLTMLYQYPLQSAQRLRAGGSHD